MIVLGRFVKLFATQRFLEKTVPSALFPLLDNVMLQLFFESHDLCF